MEKEYYIIKKIKKNMKEIFQKENTMEKESQLKKMVIIIQVILKMAKKMVLEKNIIIIKL